VHDYSEEKPQLTCIGHDHYVFGNTKEIEEYKAIRDKGVPMKSITILDPNDAETESIIKKQQDDIFAGSNFILDTPLHDTGSKWYAIGSFFLPPIGIIAGLIFKKFKHIRNYKACLKGALIGLGVLGAVVALFLLLLFTATL